MSAEEGAGLGLDIVEICRMEQVLARTPRFRSRVFTVDERAYCEKTANPTVHYATRFAAKQAVLKAMGAHILSGIAMTDIEIIRQPGSRPSVCLRGKARKLAKSLGILEVAVSLSFTHAEAVACALAITSDSVPRAGKQKSPAQELLQSFKEARGILDDLPVRKASDRAGDGTSDAPLGTESAAEPTDYPGSLPGI